MFEHLNIEYVQHPALPEAFCLKSLQKIKQSSLFKQGKIIVQDLSAMLPALVLNPSKGNQVLDMCAAPGGKTTYLSAIMNNSGSIMACDLHPHRVELIEHNVKRLGVENVRCYAGDATALPDDCYVRFDAVLLDAPCSGLGVLNRRADLRWRIRKSSLPEIEQLQEQLLDAACHYLKPQGTLVYSTCTLNKNENEYQIKRFLEKHPNFECVPFECLGETCESGQKTIYPYIDQTDGFFIAKLVRKE